MLNSKTCLLFLLCSLAVTAAFALPAKTDSLKNYLLQAKDDTNKVNALNALSAEYKSRNPDSSLTLINQAILLAEKINFKKGKAEALRNKGGYHLDKASYNEAMKYYFESLRISAEIGDRSGVAKTTGNIGIVYRNQANYPKALEYYFKAMQLAEELGDQKRVAIQLGNIGNIYKELADYPRALDHYFKALKMAEAQGNKNVIAIYLLNIGSVYVEMSKLRTAVAEQENELNKALEFYLRSLKIAEELDNRFLIGACTGNIGNVYFSMGALSAGTSTPLYRSAQEYYFKALQINTELGNRNETGIILGNISSLYVKTGRYPEAENFLARSMAIADSIGAYGLKRDVEKIYSELDSARGNYKGALEHYKKYIIARDSINNDEKKQQQYRAESRYEWEKKEAILKEQAAASAAVAAEESKRQKVITGAVVLVLLIVAIFLFNTSRKNKIISAQKTQVENKNKIIEEKNKDITDSMSYAARIQRSLLPGEGYISRQISKLNARDRGNK
ncbi:MAG: tetratricopeptide repeat protein [Bacteroidia bacterium]|nr:tetratricopeptide repeat protein [Bacteroidia bacterium]